MEQFADTLWFRFVFVLAISFLVGLEMKTYRMMYHTESVKYFGGSRTFAFIGLLGYLLWLLEASGIAFLAGFVTMGAIFMLRYASALKEQQVSILPFLVGLIVYLFGPLVEKFPLWMTVLVFVGIVFVLHSREKVNAMATVMDNNEVLTFAKLLLLSAVILPLLPKTSLLVSIPISPFKVWLAIAVVSSISYVGYLLQRYFFRERGYLIAGIIGGIYSSTATTAVLGRKAKEEACEPVAMSAAIVASTGVMYVRLLLIAAIFNVAVAAVVLLPMIILSAVTFGIVATLHRRADPLFLSKGTGVASNNPLELGIAFVFALLFIAMVVLTDYFTHNYGTLGLKIFSFAVGFTDIDPFVLSLLNGHYAIGTADMAGAVLIAAGSNNVLKACYALVLADRKTGRLSFGVLMGLAVCTIIAGMMVMPS